MSLWECNRPFSFSVVFLVFCFIFYSSYFKLSFSVLAQMHLTTFIYDSKLSLKFWMDSKNSCEYVKKKKTPYFSHFNFFQLKNYFTSSIICPPKMTICIGKHFIVIITLFSNHVKQAMVTVLILKIYLCLWKSIYYMVHDLFL